jgi:acetoin utilization deacetylase AcuC-like enzyme
MSKHLFFSDYGMLNHVTYAHPENAGRLQAILGAFEDSPYKKFLDLSVKRQATIDEISQVHERANQAIWIPIHKFLRDRSTLPF